MRYWGADRRWSGFAMLVLAAALALASGCAGTRTGPPPPPPQAVDRPASPAVDLRATIVNTAREQVGVPYCYGGAHPEGGFDCSGLVQYVYGVNGVQLPRETASLINTGQPVDFRQLRPADLVFFSMPSGGKQGAGLHVGLFVGGDRFVMIHSPSSGRTVREQSMLSPYWKRTFLAARRILPDNS